VERSSDLKMFEQIKSYVFENQSRLPQPPVQIVALDTSLEPEKKDNWHIPGSIHRIESNEKRSVLFKVKELEDSNYRHTPGIS
jgi:hypothetical protein